MKTLSLGNKTLHFDLLSGHRAGHSENQKRRVYVLLDESGSMHNNIDDAIESIKNILPDLRNVYFTFGYFSSEGGQFGFPIVHSPINSKADALPVLKLLDQHKRTLGTTCFSEVMTALEKIMAEGESFCSESVLLFLTDGNPVVNNTRKEMENLMRVLKRIAPKLSVSWVIGQGSYYNRETLSDMSRFLNGVLFHSDSMAQYSKMVVDFINSTITVSPRVKVDVPSAGVSVAFAVNDGRVELLDVSSGQALVSPDTNWVGFIGDYKSKSSDKYTSGDEYELSLASAIAMSASGDSVGALNAVLATGDVRLASLYQNAFTVVDIGSAETEMAEALRDKSKRGVEGLSKNLNLKSNAYCVVELLRDLADDNAKLVIDHKQWKYKPIGLGYEKAENAIVFTPTDSALPLSGLVFSEDKLNISLSTYQKGVVDIGDGASSVGLQRMFVATRFRNYAVIKDGVLNVESMPVVISRALYEKLYSNGLVNEPYKSGGVFVIRLSENGRPLIPVVNSDIIAGVSLSADKIAKDAVDYIHLEARQKVLNYLIKQLDGEVQENNAFTPEQADYLSHYSISNKGVFSNSGKRKEATDFYEANSFSVQVSGFASLPSVDKVIETAEKGKNLTPSMELVENYYTSYRKLDADKLPKEKQAVVNDLKAIRYNRFCEMVAIAFGKRWPNGLDKKSAVDGKNGEKTWSILHKGYEVKMKQATEKVAF